jgi:hypothetical protein
MARNMAAIYTFASLSGSYWESAMQSAVYRCQEFYVSTERDHFEITRGSQAFHEILPTRVWLG